MLPGGRPGSPPVGEEVWGLTEVDIRQVLKRSAGSTSVAFIIIISFYKHALDVDDHAT
jgi:hypothetical protein